MLHVMEKIRLLNHWEKMRVYGVLSGLTAAVTLMTSIYLTVQQWVSGLQPDALTEQPAPRRVAARNNTNDSRDGGNMAIPEWVFFRDLSGLWQWEQRDSNGKFVAESQMGFDDIKSCVADAERHGFTSDLGESPEAAQRQQPPEDRSKTSSRT
jgi:hypothetical protein